MEYPSRRKLQRAVREAAEEEGLGERRLRRWIAATALIEALHLARRSGDFPPFMIKGGFMLELRLRSGARASRDIDLVLPVSHDRLADVLLQGLRQSWSGFTFRLKGEPEERDHALRVQVNVLYQNQDWSTFEVDVVDGPVDEIELVDAYDTGLFGLNSSSHVPCMTIHEQIAQKLHAATTPAEERPRDLVDIYLLDSRLERDDDALIAAITRTFQERNTHQWPPQLELRAGWHEVIDELLKRNALDLSVEQIVDGIQSMILRLLGVRQEMNYRYNFLVLSGQNHVPTVLEGALVADTAYETLTRMTQTEGWRLVTIIPYPSASPTRAVLAVLEKTLE